MENKKTKTALINIINKKYPKTPQIDQSSLFFAMSDYGFRNNLYESPLEIAVHFAISTFNTPDRDNSKRLITHAISLNMIYDRLALSDGEKSSREIAKVKDALGALANNDIISIKYLSEDQNNRSLFIVTQSMTKTNNEERRTFLTVVTGVYYKLLDVQSDVKRINLIACYCAIASRIYMYKAPKKSLESQTSQSELNALEKSVNFSKLESIGDLIGGRSRKTVAGYIEELSDLNIIAYYKVAMDGYRSGQFKYHISKYEERSNLKSYLTYKIEFYNQEFTIIDIFDDSVVADSETPEGDTDTLSNL